MQINAIRSFRVASLLLVVVAYAAAAEAEILRFHANLDATAEVPPTDSGGTGQGEFTLDTSMNQLTFTVVYEGLTGPATEAHIHGPATPAGSAGVVVPFPVPKSPINGSIGVSNEEAAALVQGLLYVDVHTNANPSGEIRGQIVQ